MVYETDFYTTRRPYRASPSLSTYTISSEPSRQVRILPGLGKVHVVHTYDRIVPYVGHKRLTLVSTPPVVIRLRPSTIYKEFDRIENKYRPISYHSYTNDYLNSNSHVRIVYCRYPISSSYTVYRPSTLYTTRYYPTYYNYYSSDYYPSYSYIPSYLTRYYPSYNYYPSYKWNDLALFPSWRYSHYSRTFDDETKLIRAQTASILRRIHAPVQRKITNLPLPYVSRYDDSPARLSNDNYIQRMIVSSPTSKADYYTYYSEPVKRFLGQGRLACVAIVGKKGQPRRGPINSYDRFNPVMNDIELLSFYIKKFRDEKSAKMISRVLLSPTRPTRVFSVPLPLEAVVDSPELQELREQRAARLAKIKLIEDEAPIRTKPIKTVEKVKVEEKVAPPKKDVDAKKKAEEAEAKAKVKAKAEEDAKAAAEAKAKEEEAKAKAEAEAAAKAKAEAEAKAKAAAEAKAKAEAEAKAKEEAERKEKEAAELERLAEQARQEELAKQAEIERIKKEEEERERQEEEKRKLEAEKAEEERQQLLRLEEIARQAEEEQEAELARQAEELAELARQEADLAEKAKEEESLKEEQRKELEQEEIERKENELKDLEEKEKELTELAEQARNEAELAKAELNDASETAESATAEEVAAEEEE